MAFKLLTEVEVASGHYSLLVRIPENGKNEERGRLHKSTIEKARIAVFGHLANVISVPIFVC